MQLGLSSAAAPEASFGELLEACVRRGFGVVELREGDAHGLTPASDPVRAAEAAPRCGHDVRVVGYRTDGSGDVPELASFAEALGVTLLLDAPSVLNTRIARGAELARAGARVAVVARGAAYLAEADAARAAGLALAWDADPRDGALGARLAPLLDLAGESLEHIRLFGGGPETASQNGQGIGEAMGRLALAGFPGTVVVSPSSPRFRVAWREWLGRTGGSGCGSKQSDPSLVHLDSCASGRGARR